MSEIDDQYLVPANAYKYFSETSIFISKLWKFFPSLYGNVTDSERDISFRTFIEPVVNNQEFCTLSANGAIHLEVGGATGHGSYGFIGSAQINEDQENQNIYAIIVSINNQGGFVPFYVPVIIKNNTERNKPRFNFSIRNDVVGYPNLSHFKTTDALIEIIIGSMIGHLYDCGKTMFYSKFISSYNCENNTSFVYEKASITVYDMLLNPSDSDNPAWLTRISSNPDILLNIIFQVIYGLYVGKKELGFTHLDLHTKNVMVTLNDHRCIQDFTPEIPYVYHGVSLSKKDYFIFEVGEEDRYTHPIFLVIKNNGLIAKIIDYGSSAVHLFASQNPKYKRNLIISTNDETLEMAEGKLEGFKEGINSPHLRNTMDLQFFLNSIYHWSTDSIPEWGESSRFDHMYKPISAALNEFTKIFYKDPQYAFETYAKIDQFRNKGVPIKEFDDPKELLRGLVRFCSSRKQRREVGFKGKKCSFYYLETDLHSTNFTPENSLVFSENTSNIERSNMMSNFINKMNVIDKTCRPDNLEHNIYDSDGNLLDFFTDQDEHDKFCLNIRSSARIEDPVNRIIKRIHSPLRKSPFYNESNNTFFDNIKLESINAPNQLLAIDSTKSISLFNIQINPKALGMINNTPGALVYSQYQNWLDFQQIGTPDIVGLNKPPEVDRPIEIVNLNAIFVNPVKGIPYTVDIFYHNILDNLNDTRTGFIINAGFFAVQDIVDTVDGVLGRFNQQTVNERTPIGFMYKDANDLNGTHIPIPPPYRAQISGVIWCENDTNVIHIDTHDDFLAMHETVTMPSVYKLDDGTLYATDQPVIRMNTGTNIGKTPVMRNGRIRPYKWALSSGPILVNNGHVVFTKTTVINEKFQIVASDIPSTIHTHQKPNDLTDYIIDNISENKYKFRGSTDGRNPHDMTSNRYDAHDVMAITTTGKIIFFLIEGRGFNAPGLDRVQVAHLVHKFDILHAICLGSGFKANAFIKIDNIGTAILQNNPVITPICFSIVFKIGQAGVIEAPERPGYAVYH